MSNTGHSLSVNVFLYHGDSLIKGVGYLEVELRNKFIYTDAACTIRSEAATERGSGTATLPYLLLVGGSHTNRQGLRILTTPEAQGS